MNIHGNDVGKRPGFGMTWEQSFERLAYVQDWHPEMIERLNVACTEKNFSPEQKCAFAEKVAQSEILSVLRDGDDALDAFVASAFGFSSSESMREYVDSLNAAAPCLHL